MFLLYYNVLPEGDNHVTVSAKWLLSCFNGWLNSKCGPVSFPDGGRVSCNSYVYVKFSLCFFVWYVNLALMGVVLANQIGSQNGREIMHRKTEI